MSREMENLGPIIIILDSDDENDDNKKESKNNKEFELTTYSYISNNLCFEYFVGYEIATLLGYKNPNGTIRKCVSKCNQLTFRDYPGVKEPLLNPKIVLITRDGVIEILLKTRKIITPDVLYILKKFNINVTNKKCLTKEQSTLSEIANIFKIDNPIFQHYIAPYDIDLYFPDYKLVVECDENGHKDRDIIKERKRMDYINFQLNITDDNWIRYNPDDEKFDIFDLIKNVYVYFSSHKKVQYKTCCRCKENKSLENFHCNKYSKDGHEWACKPCRSEDSKKKLQKKKENLVIPVNKQCIECKEIKSTIEFWKSISGRDGLTNLCRICYMQRRKQQHEQTKIIPSFTMCSCCQKTKETILEFGIKKYSANGYDTRCKECMRIYHTKRRLNKKVS